MHFGDNDPLMAARLGETLNALAPSVVVATGDLTQAGRRSEFEAAARFLKGLRSDVVALPGNHDAPVFALFERAFRPWRRFRLATGSVEPVFSTEGLTLVALNSARRAGFSLDWSLGRLSRRQIARASSALRAAPAGTLRAVALHHPLLAGEGGRAGRAVISRAREASRSFLSAGAELVLTGHAHRSSARTLPDAPAIILVAAGTALSRRTRGEPASFNSIFWNDEKLEVLTHRCGAGMRFEPAERFCFDRTVRAADAP